jgi:restriction system protein
MAAGCDIGGVMGRRRKSGFEDLIELAAKLPWWAGVGLAAVSYLALHSIAGPQGVAPRTVQDFGGVVGGQLIRTLAGFGQYILPFVFLMGAAASAINGWKRRRLHGRVAASQDPKSLEQMTWREFEMLVGEAFRRRGYAAEETGGHGADGGVDLVLSKDGQRFLVQCKQWKASKVGVKIVRELYGVIAADRAAGGFVVTSGVFTEEAAAFAAGKNIDLIDGRKLHAMIEEIGELQGEATQTPVAGAVSVEATPTCPRCGEVMVRRMARQGRSAGKPFWGCPTFPKCRGTAPIE